VGASFAHRHQRLDDGVAEMRRIWAGEPPFPGADEVGPRPLQAGGPPLLAGAMGPKAIARASHWADGLYGFAMNGEKSLMDYFFTTAEQAWADSGRDSAPYRMGGFWYSLADNAERRLKQYVYDYLVYGGEEVARGVADSMSRHNPDAILAAIDDMEAAGCEELMLVPATADISELERLVPLLAQRG
jgi:alkanesulfonate monooxygenase SsuD/methylene tetrahydromethanopterin reductase-like flavin-dependent oxidoreductase (luciferase family)